MTHTTRFKVLALLGSSSIGAFFSLQACSGGGSGNDAGPDGTTMDASSDVASNDAANDVAPGNDSGCPTYTGSSGYCQAAVNRCNTCGAGSVKLTACDLANFNALCTWAGGFFSAQAAAAAQACSTMCDSDASSACVTAALADAGLSTTQKKMVTDYCARCNPSSSCASTVGPSIIELNDTIAATIDSKCVPDAGGPDSGTCAVFSTCASSVVQMALAGDPCDGG